MVMGRLHRRLLLIARKIGYFQSQVILALIYFVVVAPFALAIRLFTDPLNLWRCASWHWFSEDDRPAPTMDWLKRQF